MASAIEKPPANGGGWWSNLPKPARLAIWIGTPILVVILIIVLIVGNINGTRNTLIDKGTTMNAQYQANQAELDAFVKKVNEEFQIAGAKTAALDQVLTDAVKGRYDKDLSAATPGTGGGLINALAEAYPDVKGLDVYDRIVTEISAGRENFKQVQVKLLDQIRDYKNYRSKGLFHSWFVSQVGYPQLQARIGTVVLTGKPALEQMQLIVTSGTTNQDFTSGTEAPLLPTTVPVPTSPAQGAGG